MNKIEITLKTTEGEHTPISRCSIDFKYVLDRGDNDNLGADDLAYCLLKVMEASDFGIETCIEFLVQNAIDMKGFDFNKTFKVKE